MFNNKIYKSIANYIIMSKTVTLASKKIANNPIKLPGSPFWNVCKRFGRDEAIAMVVNVGGTALFSLFSTSILFLSLIGPIIEKNGFFPAHLKEAWSIYKTTPEKQKISLMFYLKSALKNGSKSLIEDILVHDPIYIILMFAGLSMYPSTPVWLLSAISFVLAVIIVSGLEVGFTELQYKQFKKKLCKKGFELETYFESRFFVSASMNSKKAIQKLSKRFNLISNYTLEYKDIYFEPTIPNYSDRTPKIRLRKRKDIKQNGWMQTVQIVYTRANEESSKILEQCRFFPIKKDKIYFMLYQTMPKNILQIRDTKTRKILKKMVDTKAPTKKVKFERTFAHNKRVLVSADAVKGNEPYYLMEVKVYKDVKLLMEVMRYIMREFPVVQTTHGKFELTS